MSQRSGDAVFAGCALAALLFQLFVIGAAVGIVLAVVAIASHVIFGWPPIHNL